MVQPATGIPANHGGACNQAVGSVAFVSPSLAARPPALCFLCPIQATRRADVADRGEGGRNYRGEETADRGTELAGTTSEKKICIFYRRDKPPPPPTSWNGKEKGQKTLPKKSGVGGERKRERMPSIQEMAGEERAGRLTTNQISVGLAFGLPLPSCHHSASPDFYCWLLVLHLDWCGGQCCYLSDTHTHTNCADD